MKMPVGLYVDRYTRRLAPYNQSFLFVTSTSDFDEILVELDRRGKTDRWSKYKGRFRKEGGLCLSVGGGLTLICGTYHPDVSYNYMMDHKFLYVMSHEIQHCLLNLAKRIGFNPINENEPHTYMTNWVMEQLFAYMRDYHQVVFTSVKTDHNRLMFHIRQSGALPALDLVPAGHIRDALAREARAMVNNEVTILPFGNAQSVTYFDK